MEDILIPLAGMATGIILGYPIVRVCVRYVEQKMQRGGTASEIAELRDDIRAVHDRLDAVESNDHRIAELEERVDFAERLLTRGRDAPEVGRGG